MCGFGHKIAKFPHSATPEIIAPKLIRYLNTLRAYDYDLQYREGREHGNVDALSRLPVQEDIQEEEEFSKVLMIENTTRDPISLQQIATETRKDSM